MILWQNEGGGRTSEVDRLLRRANLDPAESCYAVPPSPASILRPAPTGRSNSQLQAGSGGDYAYLYGRGLGWRNAGSLDDGVAGSAQGGQGRRYVRSLGAYLARSLGDDDNAVAVLFDTVLVFAIGTVIYLGYLAACALTE